MPGKFCLIALGTLKFANHKIAFAISEININLMEIQELSLWELNIYADADTPVGNLRRV